MTLPIRRGRGGRSGVIQAAQVTDFSGGLNLEAGQFNLRKNEVAELTNMDVVGRGGVRRRKAVRYLANDGGIKFDECPRSVWTFEASDANRYTYLVAPAVVSASNRILWWSLNGGAFTPFTGAPANFGLANNAAVATNISTPGTLARHAVARDTVYGVWAHRGAVADRPQPFKISSANALTIPVETGVAGAWSPTYLTGSDLGVVNGQTIAYHYGQLFVGNTIEGNPTPIRYKSRLRWSHPGDPERWREDDWIDIDVGKDGDQITALVPYRDHLLIFKNNSVHALYGDSPETFTVVNLSGDFGCVTQEATVATPFGVFFFDRTTGVWQWDGARFVWRFENMNSLLRDETIPDDKRADVRVGWVNNRLWVGVPYVGVATARGRTLVYDPAIGQNGVWCEYGLGLGPFAAIRQADDSLLYVAGCSGTRLLQRLEQAGDFDVLTFELAGDVNEPIIGSFRMPWLDMNPGSVKQWKRPDVVVSSNGDLNLVVEAYFDYLFQQGAPRKTFFISRTVGGDSLEWAEAVGPEIEAEHQWDENVWASLGRPIVKVARGATVGRGLAMALRFTTPTGEVLPMWSVDGVTVKFKTKRVRG